jgi:HSP20 family protein
MKNEKEKSPAAEVQKIKCETIEVRPAVDMVECADGVTLYFEVPGSSSKDVSIEVKSRIMSVKAASSLCRNNRQVTYSRAFQLSDAVDVENISAATKDGVLTIELPKSERARVHRIKVN